LNFQTINSLNDRGATAFTPTPVEWDGGAALASAIGMV
jgi:hypothetical protein